MYREAIIASWPHGLHHGLQPIHELILLLDPGLGGKVHTLEDKSRPVWSKVQTSLEQSPDPSLAQKHCKNHPARINSRLLWSKVQTSLEQSPDLSGAKFRPLWSKVQTPLVHIFPS